MSDHLALVHQRTYTLTWLVTSGKEPILHNGKNTFHDITLYTHVHAILVQTLRLHRYEKCSQHEICKYSVSTITLMDGNCVKHKLYGRWKTQFARKHRLYGRQTDTNTFIELKLACLSVLYILPSTFLIILFLIILIIFILIVIIQLPVCF